MTGKEGLRAAQVQTGHLARSYVVERCSKARLCLLDFCCVLSIEVLEQILENTEDALDCHLLEAE